MEIVTVFYPKDGLTKQSHFPRLHEVLEAKLGKEDYFVKFVGSVLDFMKLIRNLRNALDHRLEQVAVRDFELQPNSNVISPTIELKLFKKSKLERQSLGSLLPIVLDNLITIFETTIAYLSNANAKSGFMAYSVREIPEKDRRYKSVKYAFWSPIRDGGFYHQ